MPIAIEAVPLFVILSALVLLGLSQSHSATHGGGGFLGFAAWAYQHTVGAAMNLIAAGNRWVISKVAAGQLHMVAAWFSALAYLWRSYFTAVGEAGESVANAVEALDHATPRRIRREVAPVRRLARSAHEEASHARASSRSTARALDRFKARTNHRLHAQSVAIDVTLPGEIGRIRAREGELERVYKGLRDRTKAIEDGAVKTWDWLRSHERSAAMGAFAGAVAFALSRLGLGGLNCRSLKNMLRRRGCGTWSGLDALLGVAFIGLNIASLEETTKLMQRVTEDVTKGIAELLDV